MNIKDYLLVAWRRRWLVFSVTLAVSVTTLIVLAGRKPLFTASAQVLLERAQSSPLGQPSFYYYDPYYAETQLRLIDTDDFARKVVDELNARAAAGTLPKASQADVYAGEPFHGMLSRVRTITDFYREKMSFFYGPSGEEAAKSAPADDAEASSGPFNLGNVRGGLKVKLVPKTEIIEISSTQPDPERAALVANTVAEVFLKDRLNRRLGSLQQAVGWLQAELKDEQIDLDKSRIELYEYMNQYGILSIDEKRGTKLDEELKLLEEKVRIAHENTASLALKYEQVLNLSKSPALIDTIPEAMTNKVLGDLRTQEIQLQQEAIKLSAVYGSNHPKIMALERQIQNIRTAKNQEIQKIVNALKVQYDAALMHEKSLVQSRDHLQRELDELKKQTVRYFTLKREVESNEKVYDVVLNRLKETTLTEEFTKTPNATIIQRAVPPLAPSSPDVRRGLPLGILLALALGVGLAFLLEFLDNTFTKPEQIEHLVGLTFLGGVPSLDVDNRARIEGPTNLPALTGAKSSVAEAYRALRTSILLSSADVQPQVILITSPGKSEGKSMTAANLATVMAQAGNRVVLVDCDLRKPKQHKNFNVKRDQGLSALLVARKMELNGFVQQTAQPNLDIITSGPIPPNPSELLGSKRMHALLDMLREAYDRVIIDTPPILAATDAAVLTPQVDGTVLVFRAGDTTRQMAQRAVKLLSDLNARITGVVLNEVMVGKNGYYYYDYYYYGHYYGEEEEEGGKRRWRKKRRRSSRTPDSRRAPGTEEVLDVEAEEAGR